MLNEIKVFRDPIYGYVKVYDKLIWELIATTEFQRLRRIRQLGGAYMVFHTAEHSRFSHSLGVYELARQMVYANKTITVALKDEEKLLALCSALLHDIGHGPFSHAFESVFDFHHEDVTVEIIKGDTEINKVLSSYDETFPDKIASIIQKKYPNQILVNIISGGLDADRLDYLERDSYFTGAKYGTIDLQRILRTLKVHDNQLVVKESSLHTIEDFLLSRYHMFLQIYLHPTVRSFELILANIFKRINYLIKDNYIFKTDISLFKKLFEKDFILNDYLMLDDYSVLSIIKLLCNEKDSIISRLSYSFVNRKLFKYFDVSSKDVDYIYDTMYKYFKELTDDPSYYLVKVSLPAQKIYEFEHRKESTDNIRMLKKDGTIKSISEVSPIFSSIKDFVACEDIKIFYDKSLLGNLESVKNEEIIKMIERYTNAD